MKNMNFLGVDGSFRQNNSLDIVCIQLWLEVKQGVLL